MRALFCVLSLVAAGTLACHRLRSNHHGELSGRALRQAPGRPRCCCCSRTTRSDEPRMQIDDTPKSQMVFGVTVDGWKPGEPLTIGDNAQGYPRASLKDVPAGDYTDPGRAERLRDLSPVGRQDREAGAGSRRRPALESRARAICSRSRGWFTSARERRRSMSRSPT